MAKAVSYSESIPCLTLVDTNSETVSIYNKPSFIGPGMVDSYIVKFYCEEKNEHTDVFK